MNNAKQEKFELDQEWVELMVDALKRQIQPGRNTKIFLLNKKSAHPSTQPEVIQ